MIILHGAALSPLIRKVMLALAYKGLDFELRPSSPFEQHDQILHRHPLGKVPTMEHEGIEICDSTVIAHYLDDIHPAPPLYPGNAQYRAKVRWLEEYCDSHLTSLIAGVIFYQRVIRTQFLDKPCDEEAVELCIRHHLPPALDYLSQQLLPRESGGLTMADISLWSVFRSGWMAGLRLSNRYEALKIYLEALEQEPSIANLMAEEDHQLKSFYCEPVIL